MGHPTKDPKPTDATCPKSEPTDNTSCNVVAGKTCHYDLDCCEHDGKCECHASAKYECFVGKWFKKHWSERDNSRARACRSGAATVCEPDWPADAPTRDGRSS